MRTKTQAPATAARPESFQIKGGLFPMTLLEIKTCELDAIAHELRVRVEESPAFFQRNPLVIGLEHLKEQQQSLSLEQVVALCRELGFIPTAIKGGDAEREAQAYTLGLAALPKGKAKGATSVEVSPSKPAKEQPAPAAAPASSTQIIDSPVRSGQQIYVKGDLVITSSVSAGAEILADGSIHIYGALRGRALAGVQGDENARIFCHSQEAELIAVAGHYLVDEDLKSQHWKAAVQAYCAQGKLVIAPLS
jgi:septum site-determining protein MinC